MSWLERKMEQELAAIREKNRYRSLKPPLGIDLSSNDYLCLAENSEIIAAYYEGLKKYGSGSTASRLIRGHREVFTRVENHFAKWVGAQDSLFVANGFVANLGLIDLLSDEQTVIFSDKLNHASILDGIRLGNATVRYYKHVDMADLDKKLQTYPPGRPKIIITESIFSMDGDLAPIQQLLVLKKKYNAILMVDEAHALGILGKKGAGLATIDSEDIDIRIYTCGKSMGLQGAMIAGSQTLKEYLINRMRTFIFSTAPGPAIAHALQKSIDLVQAMDESRQQILELAQYFRHQLQKMGLDTGFSQSHIVPVRFVDEKTALAAAESLQKSGYDIRAIRPPTVKKSRLRISINASTTKACLDSVVEILKSL